MRKFLIVGALAWAGAANAATACGALKPLKAPAAPGWCAAVAATSANGLRMPRSVLWLGREGGVDQLLVLDAGSWEPRRGKLLRVEVDAARGTARSSEVLTGLDRPHGLRRASDGRIYVAEVTRVSVLEGSPVAGQAKLRPWLEGLPAEGRHPLKAIAFAPDGTLYISVGSASDACESGRAKGPDGLPHCPEMAGARPQSAVYRVMPKATPAAETFAIGLRNSTALAVDAQGRVWQGENNIDDPQEGDPSEEINLLKQGAHYGWPGCHGMRKPVSGMPPEACERTELPVLLMPAHAAPLHMEFSRAGSADQRVGLLVSWHGYRAAGNRLVRYELNAAGQPAGQPRALLGPWSVGANRPGAPVGWAEDDAGQLWIADDRNRMLIRLSPSGARP